ncbi:beta-N-acetylhexosaminidase [Algoriphagus halophytocola]|uniref:Beta-N-acetylhexosaminidase n=1 Tax=Algoriphagus halophytocola TaxID=2991499 RepID=A0ABY6MI41_9BACT|nr:beta-N-acetylhexosaminidase [Algoriphagus sp. TR-M5]UZD22649.1 beta-N-acetylhexosaminidase [Algoriphagus sp. TR-M5]
MRYTYFPLVLLLLLILGSCGQRNLPEPVLTVLPSPVSLEITGKSALSTAKLQELMSEAKQKYIAGEDLGEFEHVLYVELDPELELKPEGYVLTIARNEVRIKSATREGHWYGLITLGQLLEDVADQGAYLPTVRIKDEPALRQRVVHLDVKHHLEQKEYYFEMMDRLAYQKINAIILEIEDKLNYESQPEVASLDAFSIEEWKEISDYAMARNIRISPLVQGLGHASFILKHEQYVALRDDPASDWAFNPLDDGTYEVQFDLYNDALKAFPYAEYLHVGGDEVHTTGRGSGKTALELQLTWLNKVSSYAEDRNLTPIFWDDMPLKNAGVYQSIFNKDLTNAEVDSIWAANEPNLSKYVDMFPKNCVYMRWNYSAPETYGNKLAMKWFTDNGLKVMGATAGQTRWNLMPLNQSNTDNIRDFALISIANGAEGLLLTLWDDDSPHFELYWRGIGIFAEYTWAGERRTETEIHDAYRARTFGAALADSTYAFINELEDPVAFWKNALLASKDRNRLRSLANPMEDAVIDLPRASKPGQWTQQYAERLEKAQLNQQRVDSVLQVIAAAKDAAKRNVYTLEVYEQVAKAVQFSNHALLLLSKWDLAETAEDRENFKAKLLQLEQKWQHQLAELEQVYGQTRQLDKPEDYLLDQDHHVHLSNQAIKFSDWQFYVEELFQKKIKEGNSLQMEGSLESK